MHHFALESIGNYILPRCRFPMSLPDVASRCRFALRDRSLFGTGRSSGQVALRGQVKYLPRRYVGACGFSLIYSYMPNSIYLYYNPCLKCIKIYNNEIPLTPFKKGEFICFFFHFLQNSFIFLPFYF